MTRRLPPLTALRAFEATARHLSVSEAARELHVTQSAVSQQVRALEDHLGLSLFRRAGGRLHLTPAGRDFYPALQSAFDSIDAAAARLTAARAAGALTVSLLPTFAVRWLIPRLGRFQDRHPEIEVRLIATAKLADFTADDVDVAIRYGAGHWPGLRADMLMVEDMFPVCAPGLKIAEPADLAGHTLLQVDADPRREDWQRWLAAADVASMQPAGLMRFDSSAQALEAAAAGLGLALAHRPFVVDDLAHGRLLAPFDITVPARDAYYLVYPADTADLPRIAAFRGWLMAEASDTTEIIRTPIA